MVKHLKPIGMLMLLTAACGGFANANSVEKTANIEIVQQIGTCTGVVKDGFGETVIGASVVVKGTNNGTITGMNGDFSLPNVQRGDIIQISFVGYLTQEVKWTGAPLSVLLKEDYQTLDEVVVVGYGSQKKVNLTGSVSQVKGETLQSRPVANAAQALQGVVPGLNLSVSTGGGEMNQSMAMNIRGTGSIGSGSTAAPLVLIDGIEGDLNTVNPNDIESISVLKDAASASIYGARGSFGVVLITTKNGKVGKTNVAYSGNVRFSSALGLPEMLDSYSFDQSWNASSINSGGGQQFTDEQ